MGFGKKLFSFLKHDAVMPVASSDSEDGNASMVAEKMNDEALGATVEAWLREHHSYRTQGYSRAACAQELSLQEYQLSRLLNQKYQKNFNEFINGFRVEEAKDRLKNEPKATAKVIAFEVGFSSIASFNRVFKEMVGKSPTEYRKSPS